MTEGWWHFCEKHRHLSVTSGNERIQTGPRNRSQSCYYGLLTESPSAFALRWLCAQESSDKSVILPYLCPPAACNVWYLCSVEMESLTGVQAVQKATTMTLSSNPPPTSTVVHFKVSSQGITLTDNQRKWVQRRKFDIINANIIINTFFFSLQTPRCVQALFQEALQCQHSHILRIGSSR